MGRTDIRVIAQGGDGGTVDIGMACLSGMFERNDDVLYICRVVSSVRIRHQVPVTDYLRLQARYAHLFRPKERTEVIERIQASADRNIARFGLLDNQQTSHPERLRLTPDPHHYSPDER